MSNKTIDLDNICPAKKIKLDCEFNDIETQELSLSDENEEFKTDTEKKFGIRIFLNSMVKKFEGSIKKSPSDFIVNEIDLDGNVVKLNNFDLPFKYQPILPENNEIPEQISLQLNNLIGNEKFQSLMQFLNSNSKDISFKIDAPNEKSDRKFIHDFIKQYFSSYNTNTIQNAENKQQSIEVCHNNYKRDSMKDCFKNNSHKELMEKKFCECVLFKKNIDTIQAINLIAKQLRIQVKRIGFAGTKDKKAKTSQRISFFKMDPRQLLGLNKIFHNVQLGNFKLSNDGIKLGDLKGNRFRIVIRNVKEENDIITHAIESLKNNGFINYFGMQRFGNCIQIPTHLIGKLLIQNNLKDAIENILKPRPLAIEREEIKKARFIWNQTQDANQAFKCLDKINCIEKYILKGLIHSNKNDYLRVFQNLPRNMRLMYLHAYQSFIWNEAASYRISSLGLEPCLGDLAMSKINDEFKITVISDKNIDQFSIEDIVLPLPGHNIIYPNNLINKFYDELLEKDQLKKESFHNKIKDFSLGGDYRKLIVKPNDLKYEVVSYSNDDLELIKNDYEMSENNLPTKSDTQNESNLFLQSKKAVILEFNLPTSSYATMAMREIYSEIL